LNFKIRSIEEVDIEAVVQLSLLAWEPVFLSMEHILGRSIFAQIYPDWLTTQRALIESVCKDEEKYSTYVAEAEGAVLGFIAYTTDSAEKTGEVELLAVHPENQNHGIGTELNKFVLNMMRESGVRLAVVGTGGDPAHAPARRCYEKAGFTGLPIVRYYQDLTA
jgi:ribosomal protein S18 acetylase RimI-like enzyme